MTEKRYHIKTYGCQMNVYDSDRMREVLEPLGYAESLAAEEADLVILNTCHIREKAEDKVYSELGRLRIMQKQRESEGKSMVLAVGGCVGQAAGEEIRTRAPYVGMVFGPQTYHRLPEMLAEAERDQGAEGVLDLEFSTIEKFDTLPVAGRVQAGSAFLSVQEGCDKFCTFCVVPYTRGAEISRSVQAVMKEAENLASLGAVELTLLGQNVNAYHGEGPDGKEWSLARLIDRIAKISGLKRIRYTTSHPRNMTDDLIQAHGDIEELMPYLHLPVQSGSDDVLKRMNRKHSAAHYLDIIGRLREARPDLALSSDFIVGFPGESDQDFQDTLRLVESVGYAQAYSFKYSPRPGTPAADQVAQVEESVKQDRLLQLQDLLNRQQLQFNQSTLNQEVEVLFEKEGRKPGQYLGKSPYLQSVHVENADLGIGQLHKVRMLRALNHSIAGEVMTSQEIAA